MARVIVPGGRGRMIVAEPLDARAFEPYGEVIDRGSTRSGRAINGGTAQRIDDLARVDASLRGGHVAIKQAMASGADARQAASDCVRTRELKPDARTDCEVRHGPLGPDTPVEGMTPG
jgi:hypothetical protein